MLVLEVMKSVGEHVEVLQVDVALRLHHICCLVRLHRIRQDVYHSAPPLQGVRHLQ